MSGSGSFSIIYWCKTPPSQFELFVFSWFYCQLDLQIINQPITRETLDSTTYVERGEEGGVSQ